MKHNNFGYLMGEGLRAMFKHGFMSFAAICITVACLVIINSFALISYNLNQMVTEMQEKMRFLVIVDETYTEAMAKSVQSEINLHENVANTRFISREEAFQTFVAELDESFSEGLDASTMQDQIEVTLEDNALVAQTKSDIEQIIGVDSVEANLDVADAMVTIRNVLYVSSLSIAGALIIVSLIIISNTIRLAMLDRKEEIAIMKMVGATNGFIRFPFLIEGFLLGLFSALLSFFIEWGLYEVICNALISSNLKFLTLISFRDVLVPMIGVCGISGFLVGILGSLLSIRRFLKV